MIIGIPASENNITCEIDDRFGRCEYMALIEIECRAMKNIQFIENTFKDEVSGAGQKLCKFLFDNKVNFVIVPELGPKAKVALKEVGILAYKKDDISSIEEAIERFLKNSLESYPLEEAGGLRRA